MNLPSTFSIALLLACASSAFAQNSPASKLAPQKGWLTDLTAAKAQARNTGKPLMVVFRCDP
jgi:hypothetical protein